MIKFRIYFALMCTQLKRVFKNDSLGFWSEQKENVEAINNLWKPGRVQLSGLCDG